MSLPYRAPIEEMRFCIQTLFGATHDWPSMGLGDFDLETAMAVLDAAGSFCADVLLPLNAPGDAQGCTYDPLGKTVKTPEGYKAAFDAYRKQGWSALACLPKHGGQGLPQLVQSCFNEMQSSTCQAFGMYPLLSLGAYECLLLNAEPALQDLMLPRLASGEWTGTMCLTEPQCGTDLGLIRTKADLLPDETYALSGSKIFISSGEHDLAANIVHLVLARLPGAPAGTKGISLFAVPKFHVADDGSMGGRNGITCTRIEEKMGIHGNSTCEMLLDGAVGRLVGKPHQGLRAMFVMMNGARLGVALQGVGISEASYQAAKRYAFERLQSRALSGPKRPDLAADPIACHPDVRRMLLTLRSRAQTGRMIALWAAHLADLSVLHADPEVRAKAASELAVLTPLAKARLTDQGFESANLALQIHGGHGYIRDHGVEQLARDSRINMIYEGANGIQALDLLGRKTLPDQGKALFSLCEPIGALAEAYGADSRACRWIEPLTKGAESFQVAATQTGLRCLLNPEEAGAASVDFLNALGCLLEGFLVAKSACLLLDADDPFARSKRALADFHFDKLFPELHARLQTMSSGASSLMDYDDTLF